MWLFLALGLSMLTYDVSLDRTTLTINGEAEELTKTLAQYGAYSQYTSVNFDATVQGLGSSCFSGFVSMKSIIISQPLTYTKDDAFAGCSNLRSITFPDKFSSLGKGTFFSCTNLQTITFPSTLQIIASTRRTFHGCVSLQKFIISGNPIFSTIADGTILVQNKVIMVAVASKSFNGQIPAVIERIEDHVFSGASGVSSITFETGSNLTYINSGAFRYTSLRKMEIPSKVTYLGPTLWEYTDTFTEVSLPGSLTSVDENVFSGADNIHTVHYVNCVGVSSDAEGILYNQDDAVIFIPSDAKKFIVKETTKVIPVQAIQTKRLLKNVTVSKNNTEFYSKYNILYTKAKMVYACPGGLEIALIEPNAISIGSRAFQSTSVRNVTFLGNRVENIYSAAFLNVPNLSYINIPEGLKTISNDVFNSAGIIGMTFTLPSTIEKMQMNVFYFSQLMCINMSKCTKLKVITENLFRECKYLKEVLLPSSITEIQKYTFYNNIRLKTITMPANVLVINENTFEKCISLQTVIFLGTAIKKIGAAAFKGCNLTNITIPASVTEIGSEAFYGNTNLQSLGLALESNLESIYSSAIQFCNSLLEFKIGPKLKNFQPSALAQASSLTQILVSPNNPNFASIDGVLYNKNTTYVIACPGGLKEVSIKGNVTTFSDSSFYGCVNLVSIDFDNVPLSVISPSSFYGCTSLKRISIPSGVTKLMENAFNGCSSLDTVAFKQGSRLLELGSAAFSGCKMLAHVTFEGAAKLQKILPSAFAGCVKLEEFTFPASVIDVGASAFLECTNLKSIQFVTNGSLTSIGDSAFRGCSLIKELVIPHSLASLGTDSFRGCWALQTIEYCGLNDLSSKNAFLECKIAFAVVSVSYSFAMVGGLQAVRLLDKDCQRPTAAFTADGGMELVSDISLLVASIVCADDV